MRSQLAAVGALLIGAYLLAAAGGIQTLLLPLRAQAEGFPAATIGLIGAGFATGFVAGCVLVPRILARVGHIRTFAVMASCAAFLVLAMSLTVHPLTWTLLRMLTGFCFAGGAMVVESWLNERATNTTRGSIVSTYMVANLAGTTTGQLTLTVGAVGSHVLFVVAAMLFCLALLPTALSTRPAPVDAVATSFALRRLFHHSPLGAAGCFAIGAVNGAFGTLGAVFLKDVGYSVPQVAVLMSTALIGGALLQLPLGRLSDLVDRRYVLALTALTAAVMAMALEFLRTDGLPVVMAIFFLLGGSIYSLYALAVAHANDRAEPDGFVETARGLLLLFGVGAIVGPLAASLAMELTRPGALLTFITSVHLALAVFAVSRIVARAAVPAAEREGFSSVPRNPTPTAVELDPRASGGQDVPIRDDGGG